MERAIMCPQCNAPLAPHRFARSVVCSYCGATVQLDESSVSAEIFHNAFRVWNSPANYQVPSWFTVGESHWSLVKSIAHGDISDVYTGQRARWPTELAVIKLLRDRQQVTLFDNEWDILQALQRSAAPGADTFTMLLPQPIVHGDISAGAWTGRRVNIFRWASGFYHTFAEVSEAYPQGIPPRASIWIWRRILEVLYFIHKSGMAHGAVLPSHLLVQENEHGVRLVGYSAGGRLGEKVKAVVHNYASFYPKSAGPDSKLTAQLDITMSARCMIAILGGNPDDASLPKAIPAPLARLIQQTALAEPAGLAGKDAWSIRQELGVISDQVYGAPEFIPVMMPS